jgi:hypothetical protein
MAARPDGIFLLYFSHTETVSEHILSSEGSFEKYLHTHGIDGRCVDQSVHSYVYGRSHVRAFVLMLDGSEV